MELTREDVNHWLEENRRGREWLAERCDVGVAAVGHWLNKKGEAVPIPAKHQMTIRRLMEEDEARKQSTPAQNLILEFTDAEFTALEQAALHSPRPMTVREWAKKALNEAAHEDMESIAAAILKREADEDKYGALKVAEPPPTYGGKPLPMIDPDPLLGKASGTSTESA